jgi:hypothetical protein
LTFWNAPSRTSTFSCFLFFSRTHHGPHKTHKLLVINRDLLRLIIIDSSICYLILRGKPETGPILRNLCVRGALVGVKRRSFRAFRGRRKSSPGKIALPNASRACEKVSLQTLPSAVTADPVTFRTSPTLRPTSTTLVSHKPPEFSHH